MRGFAGDLVGSGARLTRVLVLCAALLPFLARSGSAGVPAVSGSGLAPRPAEVRSRGAAPPVISAFSPAFSPVTVSPGETVRFIVECWEPSEREMSYAWRADGKVLDAVGPVALYRPAAGEVGPHVVTLEVSSPGGRASVSWRVLVGEAGAGSAPVGPVVAAAITEQPYVIWPGTSGATVMFETDTDTTITVSYSTDLSFSQSVTATMRAQVASSPDRFLYAAPVTGLSAGTTYNYRVDYDTNPTATFTTVPAASTSFNFIAYGDSRTNP
ncbi:MAG: fibronectin type III domain-containing protein, partial [Planctomycetota bacterium]